MKKLVIKTTFITISIIFAILIALYGILFLCAPKSLAVFFGRVDNYNLSLKFYERQYKITSDITDLANICIAINEKTDSQSATQYLTLLVNDQNFDEYCLERDSTSQDAISSAEYYYAKLCEATLALSGAEAEKQVAYNYINKYGETEYNPFVLLKISK